MTEIWDPEVAVVKPGDVPSGAPSDAVILIGEGLTLDKEWTNDKGEKPSGMRRMGLLPL
jgi:hypothetical protein